MLRLDTFIVAEFVSMLNFFYEKCWDTGLVTPTFIIEPEFISRKIGLDYQPINTRVITDEKWLLFVIEQVLSNALKYTRSGKISIYSSEKDMLCIEDTGIGIAPEDLPRIFEKGYTGYNGRKDKHASGIGLYLARRICDNLGHKISARSVIGKGTAITIDLSREKIKNE